jgi:hypothetical protein
MEKYFNFETHSAHSDGNFLTYNSDTQFSSIRRRAGRDYGPNQLNLGQKAVMLQAVNSASSKCTREKKKKTDYSFKSCAIS